MVRPKRTRVWRKSSTSPVRSMVSESASSWPTSSGVRSLSAAAEAVTHSRAELIAASTARPGVLVGAIVGYAASLGEFGAVAVVSGRIRGQTNTMPLHIEALYDDYNFTGAFAVASLLAFLALVTLGLKTWVEHKNAAQNDSGISS